MKKIILKFLFTILLGHSFFCQAKTPSTAVLTDGSARFTILTPTLIRMEYAGDSVFENASTFNVINRELPIPAYKTQVKDGWLEIQTAKLLMRYKINSGTFSTDNLTVDFILNNQNVIAHPWRAPQLSKINTICEAENAILSGGAAINSDHKNFTGTGFVASLTKVGPRVTWNMNNNLATDDYTFSIKYSNGMKDTRSISLYIDGIKSSLTLSPTENWNEWKIVGKKINLTKGEHVIELSCNEGDTYNINIDWIAVTPIAASLPTAEPVINSNLGAWTRCFDGQNGSCQLWDGLISKDGWFLLDDSKTALMTTDWVKERPGHSKGYQDGYFFGYGHDYKTGLSDFYKITGNPPLLPKWAFGNWFSRYYSYHDKDYINEIIPRFRKEKVPLDVLVIDTDFKSPNEWNGWSWNNNYFPDPKSFMDWTKEQGLNVLLNIHPAINSNDPYFKTANTTAKGLLKEEGQERFFFDFSNKDHAQAYFDLHKPFNEQGVRAWWLDWCCEGAITGIKGLPKDGWINSLYAKDAKDQGLRGFAFSRIGDGYQSYGGKGQPNSAWAEHRNTIQFTGDTYLSWEMLAFEIKYTILAANIGMPYISHDLGSFNKDSLKDDEYMRHIQFGTFQPIFRLHSDHGIRLPWNYPNVKNQAQDFMRLRHALAPYIYSLSYEVSTGGMPLVRGMYFDFPDSAEAYLYATQYMFGEKMLVSPVVTPGSNTNTMVWFPEGTWTNFFTNEKVIGPIKKSISSDYTTMPVFVKAGGIIPLQPYSDYNGQIANDTLLLKVFTGDNGLFALYEDEGENLNYQSGKSSITNIIYTEKNKSLVIKAPKGTYPGAPTQRAYKLFFYNFNNEPLLIKINGVALNKAKIGSTEGWWLEKNSVHVNTGMLPISKKDIVIEATLSQSGIAQD